MNARRVLLRLALAVAAPLAAAYQVPHSCAERTPRVDGVTPVPELRHRIEALGEDDPFAALDLLCGNLPRVAREYGPQSLELARWEQAIATPLIAYLSRFDEAEALLAHARPILARRLGAQAPELAEIHVAYAWMTFKRGRVAESAEEWSAALAIRERHPGPKQIELQKVLTGLAQARLAQRQFAAAEAAAARAYGILRDNGESGSEAAGALLNLRANIALVEEHFTEARGYAEQQVRLESTLLASGGPGQPVTAYSLLGQILQRLNEYDQAEDALREAVRLAQAEQGPRQRSAFIALLHLSALLNERGKPREAARYAQLALAQGEHDYGASAPNLIPALYTLAQAESTLGELAAALRAFERAGAIIAAHGANVQPAYLVRHHRGYGALLVELGDRDAGLQELRRALELSAADHSLATDRAATLVSAAAVVRRLDPATAQIYLAEAFTLLQERLPADHPQLLRAVNGMCRIEIENGTAPFPACADASARLGRARHADPALRQAVLENQSELALRRHEPAQLSYALESLAAATTLSTPDPMWRADFLVARVLHEQHRNALAIFFGKQSIDEVQQLRRSLGGADARLDQLLVGETVGVYRSVAEWLMDAGRFDEALEVLALMKSEELSQFLVRDAAAAAPRRPLSRTPEEAELGSRYREHVEADADVGVQIEELARLRQADRITPIERSRLEQLLSEQQRVEDQRVTRLGVFLAAGEAPGPQPGGAARRVRITRLDREVRHFGSDSALAVYLLTEQRLRILIATRDRQLEYQTSIDAEALRRQIGQLLDDIAERRDITPRARALYDQLLRPVADAAHRAGATRLILWPDGPLRYVPFAALHDGERYAVERFAIQLYLETTAVPAGEPGLAPAGLAVRGFGVTKAVAGYAALPSVADELCGIVHGPISGLEAQTGGCGAGTAPGVVSGSGALAGEGFADAAFTEERLETLLSGKGGFSVLHIGTHFALRPGNALRSFLVLGDGTQLTLDRLAGIDFHGIKIMTLSGCQTGLGGAVTDDGREIEGLSALVQRRGVERVIASLWRVEDRSTALLMQDFYRELLGVRGQSAQALRLAQLALRRHSAAGQHPYEHPFYWAGFTLATTRP